MPELETVKKYVVFIEHTNIDDTRVVKAIPMYYNVYKAVSSEIVLSGRDKVITILPE